MADDLNTEIKIGADATGVEAGVGRAKRSLADLGVSAKKAGQDAGSGIGAIGAGGDKAAKDVERATKNIQGQLQRAVASFEAGERGSRKFYESLARQRGADLGSLKPLLDQLDAYKSKAESASSASAKAGSSFASLGAAAGLAARAVAAIGIGASLGEFVKMADASTNVASRLGLVTSSAAELISVQQRLFTIAQASRVSFVDLVGTYAQVARSTKDLGVSQTTLLGVIQTISQAVTISGGSAASAQAALTQLSQGFASGALRGEELNSILEQTPRLAQALADGLGVGVGKLRELGQAGALTSEAVLGALEKSAASVAAEFGKMAVTVEQASTNAANSVLKLVGSFDRLLGITSVLGEAIQSISRGLDFLSSDVEKLGSQGPLRDAYREVLNLDAAAHRLRTGMQSGVLGPNAQAELDRINARLAEAKQRFRELDQQLSGGTNPRDQSGFTGRGTSYANEAARQSKLREDANKFRLDQAGVPASYLKDMAELIRLNQAGVIVGKEYNDALKKQQDILLQKTGVTKGSAAAANAEQNSYESLISSIRAKIEADKLELAGGAALTESQRIRIKLDQDLAAGRIKLGSLRETEVRLAIDELATSEAAVIAAKALAKASIDAAQSREKYLTSLATGIDKIKADIAAQQEATARMGLTKDAIAELDGAKLEMLATDLELQAIKAMDRNLDQQTYDSLKTQAALYRDLAAAKKDGAAKEIALDLQKANEDAAKKAADEWQRAADDINRSLTDALLRGFESGKDFAKNLRDTVINMFKTMVLRPVISAIMGPVSGALGGFLGGGAQAGQVGGIGGVGSLVGGASNLLGLGGLGGFSSGLLSGGSQALLGASFVGPPASAAGGAMGIGGSIGAMMPWLLGATAIAALWKPLFGRKLKDSGITGEFGGESGFEGERYKFFKGGLFRSDKTQFSALEEEVRKALGDTFIAMRTQVKDFAEVLGLSTEKLAGYTSSIKLSTFGLDDQKAQAVFQEALATANNELAQQVIGTWETTTREVERRIATSFMEQEAGADMFRTVKENETTSTYIASEFARDGEEAIDTLTRLATSLSTVNDVFDTLGVTLLEASLSGGDAASAFADAFGGLERLAAITADYYQNFYTEEERRAKAQEKLNAEFADLGIDVPKNRDEFRKLVDDTLNQVEVQRAGRDKIRETIGSGVGGKLSLEDLGKSGILDNIDPSLYGGGAANPEVAGKLNDFLQGVNDLAGKGLDPAAFDKGLADLVALNSEVLGMGEDANETAARILGLSNTFAQLNESADEAAARIAKEEADARSKAFSALERAVAKEKEVLQAQIDIAQDVASTMGDLFDLLHDNVRELYAEVDSTRGFQAEQGNQFIAQALAAARTSGYLPDADQLAEAIEGARGGLGENNFRSGAERDFATLVLAGQLKGLEDITGRQLTDAQRTIKELEGQTEQLDKTLTYWREQIDIANGTYDATLSVADAIRNLTSLMFPETNLKAPDRVGGGGGGAVFGGSSGAGGGAATPQSKYKRPVSLGTGGVGYVGVSAEEEKRLDQFNSGYRAFDGTGDATGLAAWIAANQLKPEDMSALSGLYATDWEKWYRENGIPAYEIGTNYVPRTGLAMLHQGEAVIPKAYNPAANPGMGGQSNARLEALVEKLTAEVAELKGLQADGNDHTGQLSEQFNNWTQGGQGAARVEVTNEITVAA